MTFDIPTSLHSTKLQQVRTHLQWIDPFSFLRMLKTMVSLRWIFNEEEFFEDLFT
jgi:hypothetical protein